MSCKKSTATKVTKQVEAVAEIKPGTKNGGPRFDTFLPHLLGIIIRTYLLRSYTYKKFSSFSTQSNPKQRFEAVALWKELVKTATWNSVGFQQMKPSDPADAHARKNAWRWHWHIGASWVPLAGWEDPSGPMWSSAHQSVQTKSRGELGIHYGGLMFASAANIETSRGEQQLRGKEATFKQGSK